MRVGCLQVLVNRLAQMQYLVNVGGKTEKDKEKKNRIQRGGRTVSKQAKQAKSRAVKASLPVYTLLCIIT